MEIIESPLKFVWKERSGGEWKYEDQKQRDKEEDRKETEKMEKK